MILQKSDIQDLDRVYRLNLINALSGIKPANLVGTKSTEGHLNLAIFSSVVHLGSNPALFGMVMRPSEEVRRDTYKNIKETGKYTINAVPQAMVHQAHYTSAKFGPLESEFEKCNFRPEFLKDFEAPFVGESAIKLGMSLRDEIKIEVNNTRLIIGEVEYLSIDDSLVQDNGYVDLPKGNVAGIGGLNTYYAISEIGQFPYARVSESPEF